MKTCRRCKIEKSIDSFYKCKGMKDGYFNICKDCQIPQGQEYRRKKSLDPLWVLKNRERSRINNRKHPRKGKYPDPKIQSGHLWRDFGDKIKIIPRFQFHHWNYNLRFSVFYIHPSVHAKFHSLVKLNKEEKIYYFLQMPLDTKEKHFEVLKWVNKYFKYNYQIIEYELNLI